MLTAFPLHMPCCAVQAMHARSWQLACISSSMTACRAATVASTKIWHACQFRISPAACRRIGLGRWQAARFYLRHKSLSKAKSSSSAATMQW